MKFTFLCFVGLLESVIISGNDDPCSNATVLLDDGGRRSVCNLSYGYCDRYLRPDWYRVQLKESKEDLMMPTTPLGIYSCGTHYPIWLNGTHPVPSDGVVQRLACVSYIHSNCQRTYVIKIKNCSGYMVYYLERALGCNERYCFENPNKTGQCSPPTKQPPPPNTTIINSTTRTNSTKQNRSETPPNTPRRTRADQTTVIAILAGLFVLAVIVILGLVYYFKVYKPKTKVTDSCVSFRDLDWVERYKK